jgi:hypothetical protein
VEENAVTRDFWKGLRVGVWSIFFIAGSIFWVSSHSGAFSMSLDVYGPAVIEVPAVVWAGMLFIPSVAYLVALYINGRRWWTPVVRMLSALVVATKFAAFAVSALPALYGDIVVIWGVVLGAAAAFCACIDGIEARRQWSVDRGRN